jgi:hypothetical protein
VSELFANYFETVVGLTTEELKTKSIYSTTNKQRIGVSPQEILYVVIAASICKQLNAGMGAVGFLGLQTKKNCLLMALYYKQSIGFNNSFITVQWQRYESTNYRTSNRNKKQSLIYIIYR